MLQLLGNIMASVKCGLIGLIGRLIFGVLGVESGDSNGIGKQ